MAGAAVTQPSLLDWQPPEPPDIKGSTFSQERDGKRLNAQCLRVFRVFADGKKRALHEIAALSGDPEASISARIRDLRRFGFDMRKEHITNGLWMYWMVVT